MIVFRRAVLAVALALPGAVALIAGPPAAYAQQSAEARFTEILRLWIAPGDVLKWASVEETSDGFIARGVYGEIEGGGAVKPVPLGDVELSAIRIEEGRLVGLHVRFLKITADMPSLMTAGQLLAQTKETANLALPVVMAVGYVQGLGYASLDIALDFTTAIDLDAGTWRQTSAVAIDDMFTFTLTDTRVGVTPAFVDWSQRHGEPILFRGMTQELDAALADPESRAAEVGYAEGTLRFEDQGLMAKLEPDLAAIRANFFGLGPDGKAKTALTEADLMAKAKALVGGGSLAPEKAVPVLAAVADFLVRPEVFAATVRMTPALTLGEAQPFLATGKAPPGTPPIDWNARLTIEAHN